MQAYEEFKIINKAFKSLKIISLFSINNRFKQTDFIALMEDQGVNTLKSILAIENLMKKGIILRDENNYLSINRNTLINNVLTL